MCIAYINFNPNSEIKLLIAMNRDEFFDRPFTPVAQNNNLYYPKDTKSNGTWFAFNDLGQFALLTNIRKFDQPTPNNSRGEIPLNILKTNILPDPKNYKLFNLVWGDSQLATHYSSFNKEKSLNTKSSTTISNSKYFPSNWNKEQFLKDQMDVLVKNNLTIDGIFNILESKNENLIQSSDNTGFSIEVEKHLTPFFIDIPDMKYGTVHQFVYIVTNNNKIKYFERYKENYKFTGIQELKI